MQLYIGNKNYSSWSMRPWVLMRQLGIPFDEVKLRFDSFEPGSAFKTAIDALSPTGKVPVLVDDGFVVWDTLAIAEYLAERFPQHGVWPADARLRARARSLCAEMHAGFSALRSHCGQNLEASLPAIGAKVLAEQPAVRADLARLVALWTEALEASGGPFLFGAFSNADAYFTPVAGRVRTYGLPVPPRVAAWVERVFAAPGVAAWVDDALAEHDFRDFEEMYRSHR
ncbi:MAG TPA: glutathione S-transferase family protein [Ideonella sp.]|nr:glutathione S-transferase family protein [Ideonella sp.]